MHGQKKKKSEWDSKKKFKNDNRRNEWNFNESEKPKKKVKYHVVDDGDDEYGDNER